MKSNANQPTPPVTKTQSLADILNEIESRANAADRPKLVKALREAQMGFEVIAEMAEHAEPHSSNYAKVKLHDLSLILTSPENGEEKRI